MLKDIRVSERHSSKGIIENHRGFPSDDTLRVFGADTETVNGKPYTYQVCFDPTPNDPRPAEIMKKCRADNVLEEMMDFILPRSLAHGVNVVWFHNLNFDIRAVFFPHLQAIYDQYNDIKLTVPIRGSIKRGNYYGFSIKMLYGKVNHATIWEDFGGYICAKCGPDKPVPEDATDFDDNKRVCTRHRLSSPNVKRNYGKRVIFHDTAAFCPPGSKSLAAALKIYGVQAKKLPTPRGLGTKRLWTPAFKKYSINDARAELKLGQSIINVHRQYDVTLCVSLPQLAARILRHHFFKKGESLKFPPEPCRLASEFSYHAGKNGLYVRRGIYEDVFEYDINSAFPRAMRDLPQMVKGDYLRDRNFKRGVMGIYRISGKAIRARIPAIFDHAFRPIKDGLFRNIWATGYELECLEGNPDYVFRIVDGWQWVPSAHYSHSPLADYVDRFWKLKSETPKGPLRDLYKNLLNSLYGKFAACVEKREIVNTVWGPESVSSGVSTNKYFVAGALYHPFIASQITGYVRRDLYRLEKAGHAFHAATDSIKSKLRLPCSDTLGGIKMEVFGRCYLFRTKLYLHFSKDNSLCGHDLEKGWIRKGRTGQMTGIFDQQKGDEAPQHLCKYALHGFKGSVFELYQRRHELMNDGFIDYSYKHMVNLREGIKRGEVISTMVNRKERLILADTTLAQRESDRVNFESTAN